MMVNVVDNACGEKPGATVGSHQCFATCASDELVVKAKVKIR
jgi:hypothetical protein